MSARTFAALALGAGFLASLAACGSTATPTTAATAAPVASSAPAPVASTAAPAPAKTAPASTKTVASNDSVCPATEATLMDALERKIGKKPRKDLRMNSIVCHNGGWAITNVDSPGQEGTVQTYRYASGEWKYFVGGSAGYCSGVPSEIQKYFGEHGRGCDTFSNS
ncbi:hypothetical protein [Actinoplanes regularis]|uniref:Uncharacterized protein n=1 Tax=Actinoplanes regularis TaxID=52697 RepID=A0A239AWC0_9ACTN|nr:hypothetical protein [Actinoplanes regularis]GIE87323.1 hypothetical protein Are01nite_38030 [Actinoplanes regularis]SNR99809.1 hypothetical protein SAMN06264365_108161 [Actinoplanes regularis]